MVRYTFRPPGGRDEVVDRAILGARLSRAIFVYFDIFFILYASSVRIAPTLKRLILVLLDKRCV